MRRRRERGRHRVPVLAGPVVSDHPVDRLMAVCDERGWGFTLDVLRADGLLPTLVEITIHAEHLGRPPGGVVWHTLDLPLDVPAPNAIEVAVDLCLAAVAAGDLRDGFQ